jgi:hypothetical protein
MKEFDLLKILLPADLLFDFELTGVESTDDSTTLFIEEKNIHPKQYESDKLISKGFYEAVTIQDFPLRGKPCFLKVKRRRWLNEDTGAIVCRDWNTVAKGTRLTSDFAIFLKGVNR